MKKEIMQLLSAMRKEEGTGEKCNVSFVAAGFILSVLAVPFALVLVRSRETGELILSGYIAGIAGGLGLVCAAQGLLKRRMGRFMEPVRCILKALKYLGIFLFAVGILPVMLIMHILRKLNFSIDMNNIGCYLFSSSVFITLAGSGLAVASCLSGNEVAELAGNGTGLYLSRLIILVTYIFSSRLAILPVWIPFRKGRYDRETYGKIKKDLALLRIGTITLVYLMSYLVYMPEVGTVRVLEEACRTFDVLAVATEFFRALRSHDGKKDGEVETAA